MEGKKRRRENELVGASLRGEMYDVTKLTCEKSCAD